MTDVLHAVSSLVSELSPDEIELLSTAIAQRRDDIAIVGMACRLPGGVDDPDALWELVKASRDAIGAIPADRWDVEALYDPDPEAAGKMYTRHGGFLERIDGFDAGFFEISPREAARMDPQQRLLLEVVWEALEDAGQAPRRSGGAPTGVFIGGSWHDYEQVAARRGAAYVADAHSLTGDLSSVLAGRISYTLGLTGPSLTVDTACSSSLVALHLASDSLRDHQCDVAIAGGVSLILSPDGFLKLSRMRALSPEGRCRAFDARANGFARGEGCGVVVLKRLGDAERDGDRIRAVVRGSAINHDGRSAGLAAPNGLAQRQVMDAALRAARIAPSQVGYVEAHGTGTALGDPIELEALREVYGAPRPAGERCVVGTVKTHIGHLEPAAGVAGVIKTVLALERGEIPANLHLTQVNPRVSLAGSALTVADRAIAWPRAAAPRFAAVSSFGISGTNAHVILEEAAAPAPAPPDAPQVVALSARSHGALRALAARYAAWLDRHPGSVLADVAASANIGRAHHAIRIAVIARSAIELAGALRAFADGAPGAVAAREVAERPQIGDTAGRAAAIASAPADAAADPLHGLAADYLRGAEIAWDAVQRAPRGRRVSLPAYPFEREPAWLPAAPGRVTDDSDATGATVYGTRIAAPPPRIAARAVIGGAALRRAGLAPRSGAPATRGSEPALPIAQIAQLAGDALGWPGVAFTQLVLGPALTAGDAGVPCHVELEPADGEPGYRARVASVDPGGRWTTHLEAVVAPARPRSAPEIAGDGARVSGGEPGADPRIGALQAALAAATTALAGAQAAAHGPIAIARVELPAQVPAAGERTCRLRVIPGAIADVEIVADGQPIVTLAGITAGAPAGSAGDPLPDELAGAALAVVWRIAEPAAPAAGARRWVLLGPPGARTAELAAALVAAGRAAHRPIDAVVVGDAEALVRELAHGAPGVDAIDVLDLRADPRVPGAEGRPGDLAATAAAAVLDTVALVRFAVERADAGGAGLRLWLATRGAQAVLPGEVPVDPARAGLWGLARVIGSEHPRLWGGAIDLDPAAAAGEARQLAELLVHGAPASCALRGATTYVPALERIALAATPPAPLSPAATYLITGGLGALGLAWADGLVERGARALVLVGRRSPDPEAARTIAGLRARGAWISVVQADLADPAQLPIVADALAALPPVAGVIHAAGVLEDQLVTRIEPGALARVLAPKITALERIAALPAVRGAAITVFSSIAGLVGNPGQGAYAAANAVMDACAHGLRARGVPALAIAWGPFAGGGMARDAEHALARRWGLRALSAPEGLALFDRLGSAGGRAAVVAARIDGEARGDRSFARSVLDPLRPGAAPPPPADAAASAAHTTAPPRAAEVAQVIGRVVRHILGFRPELALDPDQRLDALGMDSMLALDIAEGIARDLDMAIPSTLALDHPTLGTMAAFVVQRIEDADRRRS